MKSIYIVDSHDIVRFGLEVLFKSISEFEVVGSAPNLKTALNAIEALRPDLLITEMSLKDSWGLETVRAMVNAQADRAVLVLSMHDESIYAEHVLRLGALGYLMTEQAYEFVAQAARAVLNGQRWVSPTVSAQLLNRLMASRARRAAPLELPSQTTGAGGMSLREVEVLEKIAQGKTTKEIA